MIVNFAVIELLGEWNDCIQNDIMFLKTNIIDRLAQEGVCKFMIVAENVLNFHSGDEDYYVELQEEMTDYHGWVVVVNLLDHVIKEFIDQDISRYIHIGIPFQDFNWRKYKPEQLVMLLDKHLLTPYLTQ